MLYEFNNGAEAKIQNSCVPDLSKQSRSLCVYRYKDCTGLIDNDFSQCL